MTYPEVCSKLPSRNNVHLKDENQILRQVNDPTHRYGNYAYRLPNGNGQYGFWVGYEDTESAASKAAYVANKNLGGVAIHYLNSDDFRGACSGERYPILRAAKHRVSQP